MADFITIAAIIGLVVLVALSAFFSASETSYTSLRKVKLKNLANEGNKRAEKTLKLAENYDILLTTILVGNNLVNIMASSICTWLFTIYFGAWGVAIATVFMLIVLLAFGEITPKTMAKANSERYAMAVEPILSTIVVVFKPISWVFIGLTKMVGKTVKSDNNTPTLTEEELSVMIDEIEGEGTLEKTESELIKSAIEFDDKKVSEILVPRVDIVAVDKTTDMEKMKDVFLTSGFSRIPVYDGTVDRIIGVVYAKDFYSRYFNGNRTETVEDLIRPVKFLPETTTVARTFSEIQKSMVQMAVIVDEYGGTVGIVSTEDLLEELVGEIWDESDEVKHPVIKESDGTYTVLGETNIFDMMKEIGVEFDVDGYDDFTVGGYIQYKLNRVPVKGDRVDVGDIRMVVRATKNRRIRMVQVIVKKHPDLSSQQGLTQENL